MELIYIGFVTSNEDAFRVQTSFAGNDAEFNFVMRILLRYKELTGLHVCSYAYNIYNSRSLLMRLTKFKLRYKFDIIECDGIGIINVPVLRQFSAFVNINFYLFRTIGKLIKSGIKAQDIMIITCNTYPMFSYPSIIMKKIFNCRLSTYLIDGFYNQDNRNLFLRLNTNLAIKALKKYDKVISLCENVLKDFCFSNQKSIAITPVDTIDIVSNEPDSYDSSSNFFLLFAGGIAPLNGICEYIEALKFLDDTYRISFYGRGELQNYLKEKSQQDSRIYFNGAVEKEKVLQYERQSNALLIVRPLKNDQQNNITRYGLPYKLIEYLQSGTPVIASQMLAIPEKFREYINFCKSDPESIAKMIIEIRMNYRKYSEKAKKAHKYMKEECSWDYYSSLIEDFLNDK